MANKTIIDKNFNGDFNITIYHRINDGYEVITPVVQDGVTWETERQGSPGKLSFKVYKDKSGNLNFQEGDEVCLNYQDYGKDWVVLFYGFVFSKKRSKDGWIEVTAYDQLRYLKNKATYVYTQKTASEVVKMIADDYKLTTGTIEDTNYVISERVEDDQSLFDIIQNALDQTLVSTGDMYVLYSDNKGLCLRNSENMKLDLIINKSVAEDFEYTSTIDDETYNEVELYYDNDETNKREYYRAVDETNLRKWGRLRYTENVQTVSNIKDRTKTMLKIYNKKTRKLNVKNTFGDCRCRAGAMVIVQMDLGDINVSNYMMIEKAKHTFKKDEYRMDLTMNDFNKEEVNTSFVYSEDNNTISKSSNSSNSSDSSDTPKTTTSAAVNTTTYDETTPETVADPGISDYYTLTLKFEPESSTSSIFRYGTGMTGTAFVNYYDEKNKKVTKKLYDLVNMKDFGFNKYVTYILKVKNNTPVEVYIKQSLWRYCNVTTDNAQGKTPWYTKTVGFPRDPGVSYNVTSAKKSRKLHITVCDNMIRS